MHSPDTPSTCLALSVGFPSPKGLDRVPTRVMKLWKTSRVSSTGTLACPEARRACAPLPSAPAEAAEQPRPMAVPHCGAATLGCALLRLLTSSPGSMRTAAALSASLLFSLAAAPAHAQIRKLVEENGRIVFVNA